MRRHASLVYLVGITLLSCAETVPTLPEQYDGRISSSTHSIFDTFGDTRAHRDQQRAQSIEKSLETFPGIVDARIHLTIPIDSPFQSKHPESGAAVLVITNDSNRVTEQQVREFILAAVPELPPEAVRVFVYMQEPDAPPETTVIGPIEVVKESAFAAKMILGGLLMLCAFASVGLIIAGIKLMQLRKTLRASR